MSDDRWIFVDEVLMPEIRETLEKALAEKFSSGFIMDKVQLQTGEVFRTRRVVDDDCFVYDDEYIEAAWEIEIHLETGQNEDVNSGVPVAKLRCKWAQDEDPQAMKARVEKIVKLIEGPLLERGTYEIIRRHLKRLPRKDTDGARLSITGYPEIKEYGSRHWLIKGSYPEEEERKLSMKGGYSTRCSWVSFTMELDEKGSVLSFERHFER